MYDAGITLNSYTSTAFTNLIDGDVVTLSGGATFADKNVGTGKTLSRGDATLGGAKGSNYTISSFSGSADITAADLLVTGLTVNNRQYDGSTTATLVGSAAVTPLGSDSVSLSGSASGSFADKNVGTAKPVTVAGLSLTGSDANNYHLTSNISADITRRDFVSWTGSADNHLWSDAGNWASGIVPDGANVSQVRLPGNGETVIYDTAAGNTSIVSITNTSDATTRQSLNVAGGQLTIGNSVSDYSNINGAGASVAVSGGALVLNGLLNPTSFVQSGGTVSGVGSISGGSYSISGGSGAARSTSPLSFTQSGGTFGSSQAGSSLSTQSFSQSGGTITTAGTVYIAHEGVPLTVGNINATQGITLHTGSGAISQSAGTGLHTNSLVTDATTGIVLSSALNQVRGFSASNVTGPVSLVSHNEGYDMPIDHVITVGNISIESWGGFHTVEHTTGNTGVIDAGTGSLNLIAHSPITINYLVNAQDITMNASSAVNFSSTSSIAAQHNISLTAGTGIALNGSLSVQSGGSISAIATTGGISATGTITATGASVSLSAPQGSVTASPSVFVGATPTILDSVAQAAANAAAQAAANAAAQAAADAAAKAAADAAAKAAADAAAKAAADAAAKAAADAAAKAAADAARAASDAAAKAAADAAAKAAADAAKAAADAAAKAAADAAAKAAADAAARAAAEAAAKAAADAAAAAAAAQAAADAAAAAAQNQQSQPVSQAINSTVNIINTAVTSTTSTTTRSGSSASTTVGGGTLLASNSGGGASSATSGGTSGSTSGPSKVDEKSSDTKKDDKKDDSKTDTAAKDSVVKKDDTTKKMYCN